MPTQVAQRRTKEEIVAAAEDVISQKGIQEATISEIASRAGVTDSVIYHYFRNKEDLLFHIIGIHLNRVLQTLHDQLQAILDPLSKLSKMVWFHLEYNVRHLDYSRILLFECRSNRNFYEHESYDLIRQYSGVMLAILSEGVDGGVFRTDVNMRLVRDLVLGAMDWETLRALVMKNSDRAPTPADIRDITNLIFAMIVDSREEVPESKDKKTRIICAAETLFSERGYWNSSIAEISRLAGVAEGTVYEYFKNKEELLFSIPKLRFREHIGALDELFQIQNPVRKLRRFIRHHFMLYMGHPQFLKTFLLDIQLNQKFYETEAAAYFREYSGFVDQIIEEGKADGSMRANVNPTMFKNLFFGGFCHVALRWLILRPEESFDRIAEIDQIVDLLTRAVINQQSE